MTTPSDDAVRTEILARLAVTREELRRILEPPPKTVDANGHVEEDHGGTFPRSRTMQMLMSGKGLGTLGALATGLLVSRPALALKLLRFLPVSTMARNLLMRGLAAYRDRQ
jgi:hypothetical protein